MSNFTFYSSPNLTLVCVSSDPPIRHSLATVARLTGVHPELLRYYCRHGLIAADDDADGHGPWFDADALQQVRRIEHYRRHLGVGRRALPLLCDLQREAERQQIELRFLSLP